MFAKLFEMFRKLCELLDELVELFELFASLFELFDELFGELFGMLVSNIPRGPLYIFTVHFTMPTLLQLLSLSCAGLIYCMRILVIASANNLVAHDQTAVTFDGQPSTSLQLRPFAMPK